MEKRLDEILLKVSKSEVIDKGEILPSIRLVLDSSIEGLNVKRAGVWFLEDDSSAIKCELLKDVANNIEAENIRLTENEFPNYFNALKRERSIIANNAQEDTSTNEFTESYLKPLGIESMLDVPIRHRGKMVGIICCEHIGQARQWTDDEASFAAALADLVGRSINAKNYYDAASKLEEANVELENRVKLRTQELETALNNLKKTQKQLVESEKMAALGGLVSGVAHEVNTPLGVSITAISHLEKEINQLVSQFEQNELSEDVFLHFIDDSRDALDIITNNMNRAANLIRDFKKTAVSQTEDRVSEFKILESVHSLISSLHPVTKKSNTKINLDCDPNLTANNHAGALSQVLTNLIINSVTHAFGEVSNPTIDIAFKLKDGIVHLEYKDNGKGIPENNISRIFEPFFTTKRQSGGSGLGLSILYNLVTQKLNGEVSVSSLPNEGTEFFISFPQSIEAKQVIH